jgi:hypothetical protein
MVRLVAPEGVTHYSHNGHGFEVGTDGAVEVPDHVVSTLEAHGFKRPDAPLNPTDRVPGVIRADLIGALDALGVAVSDAMKNDKLLEAFRAAVKAGPAKAAAKADKAADKADKAAK